jgi:hypothetical protein
LRGANRFLRTLSLCDFPPLSVDLVCGIPHTSLCVDLQHFLQDIGI